VPSDDYWLTAEGIDDRIEMLGSNITWRTFNGAIHVIGKNLGIKEFAIVGPIDEKTCEWCGNHVNRTYLVGQFMPMLPHHPNCRHIYDPVELVE
jgi:hypothetical protein